MTPSRSRHHKPTIVRAPSMISPTSSGGPHPNHWMLCLLSRSISHSRSSPRGPEPSHKSPIFPHSYHPFPHPPPSLRCSGVLPLLLSSAASPPRRATPTFLSSGRSTSPEVLQSRVKGPPYNSHAHASHRTDSALSPRTLVDLSEGNFKKFHSTSEVDVLVIDVPPRPPPKDDAPLSPQPPLTARSDSSESSFRDKPLPTPIPEEEEEDSSGPQYPWYRRRLLASDNASRYTPTQPSLFPRCDFSLSTSGSTGAGLNLFGGLVNDRAKNDVYTISVKDQSVTRLYTIGDIPQPRFGHASAYAGSVVVVWGGDIMSASSNPIRARAKYDNGLYFLNLGESGVAILS